MLSRTAIDDTLWTIRRKLMEKHGVDSANRMMYPIDWYVNTGRASTGFLEALIAGKAFVVARAIAKGGTDDEVIDRVCDKIGYTRI